MTAIVVAENSFVRNQAVFQCPSISILSEGFAFSPSNVCCLNFGFFIALSASKEIQTISF